MSANKTEWTCCGDITITDAWEPKECPFCEILRLREENERLRKDAERIDWISRQDFDDLCIMLVIDADHDGDYYVAGDDNQNGYGPTLREAIDAARGAK